LKDSPEKEKQEEEDRNKPEKSPSHKNPEEEAKNLPKNDPEENDN